MASRLRTRRNPPFNIPRIWKREYHIQDWFDAILYQFSIQDPQYDINFKDDFYFILKIKGFWFSGLSKK